MDSNRDTDEFIRLFSQHASNVCTYIHVLVPNYTDAEDIFQETSRALWHKFGEYQGGPDSGFRAWALRIAQIEVLSYRRRERRKRKLFSDQAYAALDHAADVAMGKLDARIETLSDCYHKLAEDDRRLIDARYRIGLAVETIAAELGRSVHSVYRALRRIHVSLFDCIRRLQHEERRS
jgi:RNA polymerase sigma-70 factor, ECF subfamily